MSYQVLARKWRPSQFDEVVGQTHVLEPLRHALNNDRLHHAYLFTGTRGVGKTTIARILAKALNCEQGVSAQPCGQCESCQQIDQGRFVDLLEIDAASRTKVEDTRELLDNVQYRPTQGRFKVYLIDEVHMLSRHSFNALLKTLEEPPEHVKFLLATTDPQKLPVTVVSRCLQFNLRALTAELITQQLAHVLTAESLNYDNDALPLIARAARGSMRDGLSLTDQAIAQGGGHVDLTSVQQMLGNVPKADILGLLQFIVNNDANGTMQCLEQMVSLVPDISAVLIELQDVLHRLALVQQLPQMAANEEQSDAFKALLQQLPAEVIQLYYRLVLEGRKEQPYAVDDRSGVEMTLLRLLAFRPLEWGDSSDTPQAATHSASTSAPDAAPNAQVQNQAELQAEAAPPEPPVSTLPHEQPSTPAEPPQQPAQVTPPADLGELLQMREQLANNNAPVEPAQSVEKKNTEVATTSSDQATTTPPQSVDNSPAAPQAQAEVPATTQSNHLARQLPELTPDIRKAEQVDDWSALIAAMNISGLSRQLLLNSTWQKIADKHWQINVAPEQQSLLTPATADTVQQALKEVLANDGNFEIKVEEPQVPTPLMIQQHIDAYQHQLAVEWLYNDQGVVELQQRFAAKIDESTIKAV